MASSGKSSRSSVRSQFASRRAVEQAMAAKLQESAITKKFAARLGLTPYTMDEVKLKFPDLPAQRAGFVIPYFDAKGQQTKFYRFRYLEYHDGHGFSALAVATKKLRYGQPAHSLNELYFPPVADWKDVINNPAMPIIITEGELKAACGCIYGLPTVGLGGVWCFRSAKQCLTMLPQFQEINLQDRTVHICYDSDAVSNVQIVQAENALARELLDLGAHPFIARIPALSPSAKTGLDDYLVARGLEDFKQNVIAKAVEFEQSRELCALNEEVVYIEDPGVILKLKNLQRITARAFVDHAYATRTFSVQVPVGNGSRMELKSAPREWLKWPHRAAVGRVTYQPGSPRTTDAGELNLWSGWSIEPKPGEIKPWQELLAYIFPEQPARDWFERWLAYPLQHPAIKLYTAAVLWGRIHGTGKSLIGYTMFEIYGANATEISDKDLYTNHNEWAEHKQFVMGDEITSDEKRKVGDRLKSMITQKEIRLNPKFVPSYTVPDCINYYFTSNHPDAFVLEDTDRRFFVHEVKDKPLPDAFYKSYAAWLKNGGAAALFAHLLTRTIEGFNPQGHAPITNSKMEMIDNGRSDLGTWVAQLREDPEFVLRNMSGDRVAWRLWTTKELHRLYDPLGNSRVTANGLAREMRRAGFRKAYNGMGVVTTTQGQQRLWMLRQESELSKLNAPELGKIYDDERGNKNGTRKLKY